jgi:hypothetical protein
MWLLVPNVKLKKKKAVVNQRLFKEVWRKRSQAMPW